MPKAFQAYEDNGFSMQFENGWRVSVVWHKRAYASGVVGSDADTAEVATINENAPQAWDDASLDLRRRQTANQVAAYIAAVAAKEPKYV